MKVRSWNKIAAATIAGLTLAATASAQAKSTSGDDVLPSRFDLFTGYSYLHPKDAEIDGFTTSQPINLGAALSAAAYFNRTFGVQIEGHAHPDGPNDAAYTAQAGPIFRFQHGRFVPFVHVLGGGAQLQGPTHRNFKWGYGVTGGLGFDYVMPGFHNHLGIRPIQADFNYNHVDYGPLNANASLGGVMKMQAYTLSSGLVFRFGGIGDRTPVGLTCAASPGSVYAGDPVSVTGTATGLNPKRPATYSWTATGGKVSGTGETTQVATDGLAPGSYTVNGRVMQGGHAYQQASCSTEFTVKPIEPPTITCSASPSSIRPGESSTITAQGVSSSNRPLTYSYSASAGQISGSGPSATLSASGAAPGGIVVTCNVVDDKGQTASTTTNVQVMPAAVAAAPATRQLCSISFDRDARRPARVNNEAKGCLDDIALTLQRESDSKLVMVGSSASSEKPELAAERAANAKLYLTREKGIDPTRIALRTGSAGDKTVTETLVPAGTTFDEGSTTSVDESAVHHRGEAYGRPGAKAGRHGRRHGR